MKLSVLVLAISLFAALLAGAQDDTIRVTIKTRGDGSKSTTITDPEKRTATETVTDAGGKVRQKTTYLLGERDLAVGAIFYDAKDKVVYKATYTRDPSGNVTEAAFTAPDDRYLGKRVFIYGADGHATQVIDYDANGQVIPQAQAASKPSRKHH